MAQRSYFFDSVDHDRIYTAADFARVFGAIAGRDGVIYGYGDELKVTPGSGMNVTVGTGAAFVQGRMLEVYDQAETLPIATADATNPRIDRVVVRVDLSSGERRAYLAVKTGTAAATPVAPLLQQDSTIWELSLAQVRVGAGATGIVVEDITDEREYTSLLTDQLLTHLADLANPHAVTAAQIPYTSTVVGFDPAFVSAGLDVLAGSRIVDHNLDVVGPPGGHYMRAENGWQMCWYRSDTSSTGITTSQEIQGVTYYQQTYIWTYPAAFVSRPVVLTGARQNVSHAPVTVNQDFGDGMITLHMVSPLSFAAYAVMGRGMFAIGRWK